MAIRYGILNEVLDIDSVKSTDDERAEIAFIQSIVCIQKSIIADETPSPRPLEALYFLVEGDHITDRVKIGAYNLIIVAAMRFKSQIKKDILDVSYKKLLDLASRYQSSNNITTIISISMAYRGMAMIDFISDALKQYYMDLAEKYARSISSKCQYLDCLIKENLFTCCQSQSKWYDRLKQDAGSYKYLKELSIIDPNDSVGHAEMGFYYLNKNEIVEARECFKRAYLLGPPGVGMHMFYYAKCFETEMPIDKLCALYMKAFEIDSESVTPLLEIIYLYNANRGHEKVKWCVNTLLSNSTLSSQLEGREIEWLGNLRD